MDAADPLDVCTRLELAAAARGAGSMEQTLREARVRVASHRAARARARRLALSGRVAALAGSLASSVRGALAAPAAAGESFFAMHARADAALAEAARGSTLAGWLRAASGRLYRGWGNLVFAALCWLLGVKRQRAPGPGAPPSPAGGAQQPEEFL
jgi:hypothetical protein